MDSRRDLLTLGGSTGPSGGNYGPNLGYDYGGRLTAAWLDR